MASCAFAAAVPELHPRDMAGLKLGYDLVGDFVIKTFPVGAMTGATVKFGHHGYLRDGRQETLSQPSTRHGKIRPHSHSGTPEIRKTGEKDNQPCVRDARPNGEDLHRAQLCQQPGPKGDPRG